MKLIFVFMLMICSSAFAAKTFECRDGDEVDTLVLDKHQAKIRDLTLKNTLRVDWSNRLRSYALIMDPWFDFEVDTEMLKGQKGFAYLSAHNSRGQMVYSKFYECNPR